MCLQDKELITYLDENIMPDRQFLVSVSFYSI